MQPVKKFSAYLWNPKFHYRTHKRPPPVPDLGQPIQSTYPQLTSCKSILILSTHLRLFLPSSLFPIGFPTKNLYTPSPHSYLPHAGLSHSSRFNHPQNIGSGVKIIQLFDKQSPPLPRYLVPPRSKHSPQHHILKHP